MKKILLSCVLGFLSVPVWASVLPEYRIANGLTPTANGQSITSLKPYAGQFRILGTKTYTQDEQAKFSPIDYAVSIGMFASPDFAKQIQVKQYDRFLNWQLKTLPVAPKTAMQMVSNMHIVPANPKIAQQIKQVSRGDLVKLKGDLVEIKDQNLVWRSSLSHLDVGEGACELFRVNSIQWIEKSKI